jgi:hypothetical protein
MIAARPTRSRPTIFRSAASDPYPDLFSDRGIVNEEPIMDFERKETIEYVAPSIETLSEAEVLDDLGPARAYSGNFPFGF